MVHRVAGSALSGRWWRLLVLAAVLLVPAATPARAGPVITEPTSLSPGDQYRLAFATSTTRSALSPDITVYNAFVDALGDTVIVSDWRAIASTSAVDARDNTGTLPSTAGGSLGVPIFLLSDTLLFGSNDDLWDGGTQPTTFSITETGDPSGVVVVWTGTDVAGTDLAFGLLGGLGGNGFSSAASVGSSSAIDSGWITGAGDALAQLHPLYALSDVLTIPTEVPALPRAGQILLLALLGVASAALTARRRRAA